LDSCRASNTNPRKKSIVSEKKKKKNQRKKKSNFQEQNQIPSINNFKQTHFLPTHTEKSLQKPMNHERERERHPKTEWEM
jgi:hypothetical protein